MFSSITSFTSFQAISFLIHPLFFGLTSILSLSSKLLVLSNQYFLCFFIIFFLFVSHVTWCWLITYYLTFAYGNLVYLLFLYQFICCQRSIFFFFFFHTALSPVVNAVTSFLPISNIITIETIKFSNMFRCELCSCSLLAGRVKLSPTLWTTFIWLSKLSPKLCLGVNT